MKGIYLAAGNAYHKNYDIVYQDINGKRDLPGDMLSIDLNMYDYIIATPPCNYWSKARGNRISEYSINTKHLLPGIIKKCELIDKPYIIENVRNYKRMKDNNIFNCKSFIYFIGRHTYFSNIYFDIESILQRQDFTQHGWVIKYDDMETFYHQGGYNVYNVIERWLQCINAGSNH